MYISLNIFNNSDSFYFVELCPNHIMLFSENQPEEKDAIKYPTSGGILEYRPSYDNKSLLYLYLRDFPVYDSFGDCINNKYHKQGNKLNLISRYNKQDIFYLLRKILNGKFLKDDQKEILNNYLKNDIFQILLIMLQLLHNMNYKDYILGKNISEIDFNDIEIDKIGKFLKYSKEILNDDEYQLFENKLQQILMSTNNTKFINVVLTPDERNKVFTPSSIIDNRKDKQILKRFLFMVGLSDHSDKIINFSAGLDQIEYINKLVSKITKKIKYGIDNYIKNMENIQEKVYSIYGKAEGDTYIDHINKLDSVEPKEIDPIEKIIKEFIARSISIENKKDFFLDVEGSKIIWYNIGKEKGQNNIIYEVDKNTIINDETTKKLIVKNLAELK